MNPDNGTAPIDYLIARALELPSYAIGYTLSRQLALLRPFSAIVEGDDSDFKLEPFLHADKARLLQRVVHTQSHTGFNGPGKGIWRAARTGWVRVAWRDVEIEVVLVPWKDGFCNSDHFWIIAPSQPLADEFFVEVCEWHHAVRDEVMVFDSGHWSKSAELFQNIRKASFDNLVLPGTVADELQRDFAAFFESREVYEQYGVPWKRGVIFIGPPGNGKTHTVKALLNHLGQPCLYVKSFDSQYGTPQDNMRQVFERARNTTPSILVLEDLDSLITPATRSFFLNELDGFAANTGILFLATTNYPERLDASIMERPSRFDRKFHFDLPALTERKRYLQLWNRTAEPATRLSEDEIDQVAARTKGFSFAYLKELILSSLMSWIRGPRNHSLARDMSQQLDALREQMRTEPPPLPDRELVATESEGDLE